MRNINMMNYTLSRIDYLAGIFRTGFWIFAIRDGQEILENGILYHQQSIETNWLKSKFTVILFQTVCL